MQRYECSQSTQGKACRDKRTCEQTSMLGHHEVVSALLNTLCDQGQRVRSKEEAKEATQPQAQCTCFVGKSFLAAECQPPTFPIHNFSKPYRVDFWYVTTSCYETLMRSYERTVLRLLATRNHLVLAVTQPTCLFPQPLLPTLKMCKM